jgi:hypothetical protein
MATALHFKVDSRKKHLILKLARPELALNIGCLLGRQIGMIYKFLPGKSPFAVNKNGGCCLRE